MTALQHGPSPADLGLALAQTATLRHTDDAIEVTSFRRSFRITDLRPEISALVDSLRHGPRSRSDLAVAPSAGDGLEGARIDYVLTQFDRMGALSRTLTVDGEGLATLHPNHGFSPQPPLIHADGTYRLSRFAALQPHRCGPETGWQLTSPLGAARLVLTDTRCVAAAAALVDGLTPAALAERARLPLDVTAALLQMIVWCGAAERQADDGALPEETSVALRHWEPHDLQFHTLSRLGRHQGVFGGAFPFRGVEPELPARRPLATENILPLKRPDPAALRQADPPFAHVLQSRQSIRTFASRPLEMDQVGEFLFRSAALKEVRRKDGIEVAFYPYPGGGARSELTLYLAVPTDQALEPGLYRYEAEAHGLTRLSSLTAEVSELLTDAKTTAGLAGHPPLLLIIAARFRRVSWKYRAMAYAVMLKNAGALIQTLYLNATAMGLAGCALGGGNADLFSRAIGSDYYEETSIGEFVLGPMPA